MPLSPTDITLGQYERRHLPTFSTALRFHNALKKRKYRLLYSPGGGRKPGPKGPPAEVINAIVEMKQHNPRFGCPRIAQQINLAFGLDLDKDTVRRVLAIHYRANPNNRGPSWLTTIGHAKDSLWSVDLFRCESILLKSHWAMVVMDQYTRRIIGFGVHAGNVDGPALCRMFNHATSEQNWPTYLSSDNDPLLQYHRWKANLRVLNIEEIKSLPHVPMSHPFVERLIIRQGQVVEIETHVCAFARSLRAMLFKSEQKVYQIVCGFQPKLCVFNIVPFID